VDANNESIMKKHLPDPSSVVWEMTFTPGPASSNVRSTTAAAAMASTAPATTYRILRTTEVDPYDAPATPNELLSFSTALAAATNEKFAGTARRAAKLSITTAAVEAFSDVKDLIDTLPSLSDMTAKHIPTTAVSNRVQ
jgi:hypothetical protein